MLSLKLTSTGLASLVLTMFGAGLLSAQTNVFPATGNVGIGTMGPNQKLEVSSGNERIWNSSGLNWPLSSLTETAYIELSQHIYDDNAGVARVLAYSNGVGSVDNYGQAAGLAFQTSTTDAAPTTKLVIDESGNVGIGTITPGAMLEVNGPVKLTTGSGASITFPDATVQSTAWNGVLTGGDYAEAVDVLGEKATYEPGDVIVIDASSPGRFAKSGAAYSRLVAGVFSTKPGLIGRRTTADRPNKDAEVPMAMMGIVPIKVSSENGAIEPGDLLVSASTPGYVMKGTDATRMMGAVIGKALASFPSGKGIIEALISLQ